MLAGGGNASWPRYTEQLKRKREQRHIAKVEVNAQRMMQKAVYEHKQWVISLFVNEWADTGKGSFVDSNHNPTEQAEASSWKGLFPHWHVFSSSYLCLLLMVVPVCLLNFDSEDSSSFYLQGLLCSRKLSSVLPKWLVSPSPLPSLTPAWQSL